MAEIGLAEVIRALRSELEEAIIAAEGEKLRFEATALNVEFQVGVQRTAEAKGGIRFWVFEVGAGGSQSSESIQKVNLALTPTLEGEDKVKIAGGTDVSPLDVGGG